MIHIPVNRIIKLIAEKRYKTIILEAPDGLRNQLIYLVEKLKKDTNVKEVLISGERCFGPCDLSLEDAIKLKVDAILHVGHTEYPHRNASSIARDYNIDIIYIPVYDDILISEKLFNKVKTVISKLNISSIGLLYSIYYQPAFEDLHDRLLKGNFVNVYVGKSEIRNMPDGQILGCEISSAKSIKDKVDAFIVVSSGIFHPLGVSLWTGKLTILVDPIFNRLINLNYEMKRRRSLIAYNILRFEEARRIGVLVSSKTLQCNLKIAQDIYRELINHDKLPQLIFVRNINEDILCYFPDIDGFIETACPRIAIDDIENFKKPILNVEQFLIYTGKRDFNEVYPPPHS